MVIQPCGLDHLPQHDRTFERHRLLKIEFRGEGMMSRGGGRI